MREFKLFIISGLLLFANSLSLLAQSYPTVSAMALVKNDETGEDMTLVPGGNEGESFSAPVQVRLFAMPANVGSYKPTYEWRFYKQGGSADSPDFRREGEEWTETIKSSGSYCIVLYAYFKDDAGNVIYQYGEGDEPIVVSVKTSKLDFPNAFSPNGDGINDVYKAKEGYQSLVEFHAAIYSRWGQKIYEWDDPADGWDGKFNGTDVKQGVYFVHVTAKGADGVRYNIKRDVNLLRGYTEKQ